MHKYKFCPVCGGSLEKKKVENFDRLVCRDCSYIFYQNSKPCVGVLIESNGALMLVKRAEEPRKGWWDVPGGFLEDGEHPEAGARRELKEETGLDVEPMQFLGIYMDSYGCCDYYILCIYYMGRIIGGKPSPGSDVAEIGWFTPDRIPDKIAFKNCREAIDDWISKKIKYE